MTDFQDYIEVPYQQLSSDALQGIVADFVSRDGTDYGAVELSEQQKMDQLMSALQSGDCVIVFDPQTESCTLLPKESMHR